MLGKKITAHAGQTTVVITLQNEKLTVRHVDLTNFEVEHARGMVYKNIVLIYFGTRSKSSPSKHRAEHFPYHVRNTVPD